MTDTTTRSTQLYPLTRLADMSDDQLHTVPDFALTDAADTGTTVYSGMDRTATIATARRTVADIRAHLGYRFAMQLAPQAVLDVLHRQATAEDIERMHDIAISAPPH